MEQFFSKRAKICISWTYKLTSLITLIVDKVNSQMNVGDKKKSTGLKLEIGRFCASKFWTLLSNCAPTPPPLWCIWAEARLGLARAFKEKARLGSARYFFEKARFLKNAQNKPKMVVTRKTLKLMFKSSL